MKENYKNINKFFNYNKMMMISGSAPFKYKYKIKIQLFLRQRWSSSYVPTSSSVVRDPRWYMTIPSFLRAHLNLNGANAGPSLTFIFIYLGLYRTPSIRIFWKEFEKICGIKKIHLIKIKTLKNFLINLLYLIYYQISSFNII